MELSALEALSNCGEIVLESENVFFKIDYNYNIISGVQLFMENTKQKTFDLHCCLFIQHSMDHSRSHLQGNLLLIDEQVHHVSSPALNWSVRLKLDKKNAQYNQMQNDVQPLRLQTSQYAECWWGNQHNPETNLHPHLHRQQLPQSTLLSIQIPWLLEQRISLKMKSKFYPE